jgi:hypothetical protein
MLRPVGYDWHSSYNKALILLDFGQNFPTNLGGTESKTAGSSSGGR